MREVQGYNTESKSTSDASGCGIVAEFDLIACCYNLPNFMRNFSPIKLIVYHRNNFLTEKKKESLNIIGKKAKFALAGDNVIMTAMNGIYVIFKFVFLHRL